MPNYVKNRLRIVAEQDKVFEVLNALSSEESVVDFNKIIPMPKDLNIISGSFGEDGMLYILATLQPDSEINKKRIEKFKSQKKELQEEAINVGLKYIGNIARYGFKTWYDWCRNNWGTKWNAVDPYVEDDYVYFQTAWNGVEDLMGVLSTKFPEVTFEYAYADEDISYNADRGIISNGEINMEGLTNGSKEAFELAFELWPGCREYHILKDNTYISKEEE